MGKQGQSGQGLGEAGREPFELPGTNLPEVGKPSLFSPHHNLFCDGAGIERQFFFCWFDRLTR